MAAGHRNHDLDDDAHGPGETWADFWAATRPVELTTDVERQGGARPSPGLRHAEAVHLAKCPGNDIHDLPIAVRIAAPVTAPWQLIVAPAVLPS